MKRPTALIDQQWAHRAHEAFRESLDTCGVPVKTMVAWLQDQGFWSQPPQLSLDAAVAKFRHCAAGTHGERFRTLELIALLTRFGGHQLLQFWANSAGYRLVEVPPAEFDAALVAGFDARLSKIETDIQALVDMRRLMEARNEWDQRDEARVGPRPMFSIPDPL